MNTKEKLNEDFKFTYSKLIIIEAEIKIKYKKSIKNPLIIELKEACLLFEKEETLYLQSLACKTLAEALLMYYKKKL